MWTYLGGALLAVGVYALWQKYRLSATFRMMRLLVVMMLDMTKRMKQRTPMFNASQMWRERVTASPDKVQS